MSLVNVSVLKIRVTGHRDHINTYCESSLLADRIQNIFSKTRSRPSSYSQAPPASLSLCSCLASVLRETSTLLYSLLCFSLCLSLAVSSRLLFNLSLTNSLSLPLAFTSSANSFCHSHVTAGYLTHHHAQETGTHSFISAALPLFFLLYPQLVFLPLLFLSHLIWPFLFLSA